MRSHSLLGAFLQIQVHGAAVVVDAERDTQEVRRGAGTPQLGQINGLVQVDAQQVLDVGLFTLDDLLVKGREGTACGEVTGNGLKLPGFRPLRGETGGAGLGAAGPVCDGRLVTQVDADVNVVGFVQTVIQEVDDGHLQVTVVEGLIGMPQV